MSYIGCGVHVRLLGAGFYSNILCPRGITVVISLIVPPKDDINKTNNMLAEEYGNALSIKSRVNRLSVLGAITSTQQRLKLYNRTPDNGLILYCGEIITEDGKEKKVTIDFEPFKPNNTTLYLCDNKFHTEHLAERSRATISSAS